jgi:hypothetical protein
VVAATAPAFAGAGAAAAFANSARADATARPALQLLLPTWRVPLRNVAVAQRCNVR